MSANASRRYSRIGAILLAGLAAVSASQGQVNVSGHVSCEDAVIPEMIPIYAYDLNGSDIEVRHTDAAGNYTFLLANGTWVVQADPYYASWWQPNVHKYAMYRAEYFNNQFFYVDATPLVIAAGVTHTNIDFVLERYTEIKGRVVKASNQQPLTGIPVSASCVDGTGIGSGYLQTTTDTNGEYSLYVNVGNWKVYANPEGMGYAAQYWSNKTSIGSANIVEVNALGEPAHSNINFALQAVVYGKMSGFVYGPDGAPLPFASVNANGNNFYPPTAYANSTGYWEMATLQPDTYRISADSYPYPTLYFCEQSAQDNAHPVTVTAGADIRNVDFHLLEPGQISGTVRTKAGTGVAGAYVSVSSADGGWSGATADGSGLYTIERLPPGHYRAYASASGYMNNWYSNQASQSAAEVLTLEEGQIVSNLDFALEAGGTIAGVVSNTSGSYAGSVQALASPTDADPDAPGFAEAYSDYSGSYDGRFTIRGIRRAPVVIRSMGVSYQHTAGSFYDRKLVRQEADVIDLTTTDRVENITLFSYNEAKIAGRVTAASGGAGLAYVTTYVLTTNGYTVSHGETDESGNYTCDSLPPGTYVILAAPMFQNEEYGTSYAPRYYNNQSSLASATRITLNEGATQSGVNIALTTASGGISGRVTRAIDAAPISNHSIYVWSTGSPTLKMGSAGTDVSGNYLVRGLPAGNYRVQAWPNNFGAEQYYNGKTNYATADNVTVGSAIVGNINFALNEVVPSPTAPGLKKPLPPVWQNPVAFEWAAIEGARYYELRVDDLTAGTTGVLQQAGIANTNVSPAFSFTRNHFYRAQVRAGNSAGYGDWGAPVRFTYLPPPQYALHINITGPGSVTLDPPGGSYESGTVVEMTAVEEDGSTFDHWTGVDSGANQPLATVTVVVERTVALFFVANRPPQTPVPVAPTNDTTVDLTTAVLETSAFQDPDPGDTFGASHFVVYETEGVPLAESDTNTPQTTFALSGTGLQGHSAYFWKARFADGHGLWSDWSAPASFSTSNRPPTPPVCVKPTGGEEVSINPMLQASLFGDPDSADTHAATLWQIAGPDGNFDTPVLNTETPPAAFHLVPAGTLVYTNYFWRVRYRDNHDGWSGWSIPAAFKAVLTIDDIELPPGGTVTISWPTQTGYLYTLRGASNFLNDSWAPIPGYTNLPGTGGMMTYEEPEGDAGKVGYCVEVRPGP